MAMLLLRGAYATVELARDDEDGVNASCIAHTDFDARLAPPGSCTWTGGPYDSLDDATEYASSHADTGDQR